MRINNFLILAAIAAIAGCSGGAGTATGSGSEASAEPITLRVKGEKGDKYTYKLEMDIKMDTSNMPQENMPAEMKGEHSMNGTVVIESELVSVEGDKYTWKETVKEANATGKGLMQMGVAGFESQKGKTKEMTYNEFNKPVGDTANDSPVVYTFPEKAVKPGDTWTETVENGGQKITATYKFERYEEIGGTKAAVLSANFKSENMQSKDPMLIWVDPATGRALKAEGSITGEQNGMKMAISVKRSQV